MNASMSDGELIAHVQRGEESALEILYDRYSSRMLGLAVLILRKRDAAEDILQEAFFRVWDRAESFDSTRGNFGAWLATIVRNRCMDYIRRNESKMGQGNDSSDPQFSKIPDPNQDTLDAVVFRDQRTRVRQALINLPEDQRQVIELAYFSGLTQREIAEQLNFPPGTIHTRARLALEKLREALKEEE